MVLKATDKLPAKMLTDARMLIKEMNHSLAKECPETMSKKDCLRNTITIHGKTILRNNEYASKPQNNYTLLCGTATIGYGDEFITFHKKTGEIIRLEKGSEKVPELKTPRLDVIKKHLSNARKNFYKNSVVKQHGMYIFEGPTVNTEKQLVDKKPLIKQMPQWINIILGLFL